MLQVPLGFHEFNGQPIEQRLVGRKFALGSEVARVLAQRDAEELRPKAVHDDAGGERVLAGDEPLGEVEAVGHAAFVLRLREVVGQGRLYDFTRLVHPVAAG